MILCCPSPFLKFVMGTTIKRPSYDRIYVGLTASAVLDQILCLPVRVVRCACDRKGFQIFHQARLHALFLAHLLRQHLQRFAQRLVIAVLRFVSCRFWVLALVDAGGGWGWLRLWLGFAFCLGFGFGFGFALGLCLRFPGLLGPGALQTLLVASFASSLSRSSSGLFQGREVFGARCFFVAHNLKVHGRRGLWPGWLRIGLVEDFHQSIVVILAVVEDVHHGESIVAMYQTMACFLNHDWRNCSIISTSMDGDPPLFHQTVRGNNIVAAPLVLPKFHNLPAPLLFEASLLGSMGVHEVGHFNPQGRTVREVEEGQSME